jgi:hypothetical protein
MPTPTPDILVTLNYPQGKIEIPLEEWAARGPGEQPLLRPIAVRNAQTGARLPMSIVPFSLRNTSLSRALIKLGVLADPWNNKRRQR